ncbi:ATP-binding protein [Paenibacillus sp. PsM32]|uniref:ATP-binding protein n=1 Tax=Paenibacillus sp. PsM32 TaxID=3030536 RepID=UPI00263AD2BC|nr:ATP-binding protein [Paenibacillus sp. PsM32]MDN4617410.1 ATP-binding protein [Paenibacillus sp. PsM32]
MEKEIINLPQYTDALRSTGYKNIESAIAEIVDNSFEAEARNVFIIAKSTINSFNSKSRKSVSEIAFLDNGTGMSIDVLQSCLGIGFGTRQQRKGMGRFGVGLPQASLHVSPNIEVYSWQKNNDCYKSYLDIQKVKSGVQNKLLIPECTPIPEEYKKYLNYNIDNTTYSFKESGTLVIWKDCDNVSPKTVTPLFSRLEFTLGQKFRHWIHNNERFIHLINMENASEQKRVSPNDPLFLMKDNLFLGSLSEPGNLSKNKDEKFKEVIFTPFTNKFIKDGIVKHEVNYFDKKTSSLKTSVVKLQFSVVREEFYNKNALQGDPGRTEIGKKVRKLEGISIVRAGREIDFGMFDFYDVMNEPTHRWWGCEISFETELDEVFGVSNNKQHVELIELSAEDYTDDDIKPIWFQLKEIIKSTISEMIRRNKSIRSGSRTKCDVVKNTEKIINTLEDKNINPTESEEKRKELPQEKLVEGATKVLEQKGINEPTAEQINELLLNKVNIIYESNNRAPFFDYDSSLGICNLIINMDHPYYQNYFKELSEYSSKAALELFLASLIRARDELIDDEKKIAFDNVIYEWNHKLTLYIRELLKD